MYTYFNKNNNIQNIRRSKIATINLNIHSIHLIFLDFNKGEKSHHQNQNFKCIYSSILHLKKLIICILNVSQRIIIVCIYNFILGLIIFY